VEAAVQEAYLRPQSTQFGVNNPLDRSISVRTQEAVKATTRPIDQIGAVGVPALPRGSVTINAVTFENAAYGLRWSNRSEANVTKADATAMAELYGQLRKNYGFKADQAWKFVWLEVNHHGGAVTGVMNELNNVIYKGDGIPLNGYFEQKGKQEQLMKNFQYLQSLYNLY
jgi:hypothetical protein